MTLSFDKSKVKILLLEGISPTARKVFESAGYTNVEEFPKALSGEELAQRIQDVRILGIRSTTQLDGLALETAPKLMVAGCFCIGTNQVDLDVALQKGIPVFNAPFANTRSVAELVLSSLIALLRRTPEKNIALHNGTWIKSAKGSREARGKTLGIVGYGNIGTQLSILAEQVGMHVCYFDTEKKLPLGNTHPVGTLDELLKMSDVISLHVPETPETKHLIGARELALMKPGSCLINYARGTVVDIDALADALKSGHLGGAALDVYPSEPKSKDDPFVSPLQGLHNALLSPHVGGSTEEAQEAIGIEVAEKLVRYFDNGSTTSAVNFPNVALPQHEGSYRILNIHQNIPGVLVKLNAVLAEGHANVVGQFLQTNAKIGYVVTDIVAKGDPESFRTALKAIPGNIRTRILH
jgi:D-3-phosphoglycerate dehydrogenase / 2-oxoglutarate reductase